MRRPRTRRPVSEDADERCLLLPRRGVSSVPADALALAVRESALERKQSESEGEDMAEIKGKGFESPDEVRQFEGGKGKVELVDLNGHMIGRGTFEPGWRWSEHVKPLSGTDSCEVEHIGYVLE